jgi:hypothetical protein
LILRHRYSKNVKRTTVIPPYGTTGSEEKRAENWKCTDHAPSMEVAIQHQEG